MLGVRIHGVMRTELMQKLGLPNALCIRLKLSLVHAAANTDRGQNCKLNTQQEAMLFFEPGLMIRLDCNQALNTNASAKHVRIHGPWSKELYKLLHS